MLQRSHIALTARLALSALTLPLAAPALAQQYPVKPLRMIVPYAPGGGTDTISRLVAQRLGEALGQLVVIDNRPGAGGLIGTEAALKLPADGYTLAAGTISTLAIIPITQAKPSYDPQKDFTPVSLLSTGPYLLVAHPSLPARTVADLVRLARARPGGVAYGSTGIATGTHLTAEYFSSVSGVRMTHVPYKGDGPAVIDLLSGQISIGFFTPIIMTQHIRSGRLRGIAVTATARTRDLPDVPTVAESGYPGFESGSWLGVTVRAGTPAAVVRRLNAEIVRAMSIAELRAAIEAQGNNPAADAPEAFERFIAAEIAKWKRVIAGAGIRVE